MQSQKTLEILHFNDVYDIEERNTNQVTESGKQIIAGAARFVTAMERYGSNDPNKVVLFSGDLFGASNLSTHFRGEQMLGVFKRLNPKVSCLGNHDTDFGIPKMKELIAKTECPWLMANLFLNGERIGDLPGHYIL